MVVIEISGNCTCTCMEHLYDKITPYKNDPLRGKLLFQVAFSLSSIYESACSALLFYKCESHGSGWTTALDGMHRYLYGVYCPTPPTSLFSDKLTKHSQIKSGTDSITVPASKIKGQCAGNTPKALISAHRPRSSALDPLLTEC